MKSKKCRTPQKLEPVIEADDERDPAELFAEVELKDYITLELGLVERIPLLLRYAEGMQLVRERVIEVFGLHNVEEATRIVHELIEVKDDAAGLGDEGDCWAGWRRDHQRQIVASALVLGYESATSSVETFTSALSTICSQVSDSPSSDSSRREVAAGHCDRKDSKITAEDKKISRPALIRSAKSLFSSSTLNTSRSSIHRPAFLLRSKSADAFATRR